MTRCDNCGAPLESTQCRYCKAVQRPVGMIVIDQPLSADEVREITERFVAPKYRANAFFRDYSWFLLGSRS